MLGDIRSANRRREADLRRETRERREEREAAHRANAKQYKTVKGLVLGYFDRSAGVVYDFYAAGREPVVQP